MKQSSNYRTLKLPADPTALKYHLMPPMGWLNDPNGLCRFNGATHIFFQHSKDPKGGLKQWGHYSTVDYVNYKLHPIALTPDCGYDKDGVYSGSAFVHENKMHLYYTGNVKYDGDKERIMSGRDSNVLHVTSDDGMNFSGKELVLTNADYPQNLTRHVRDPKVFAKDGVYYMVLGARRKDDVGEVIFYESSDLKDWKYFQTMTSSEPLGYMWECPDYIFLDGQEVLLCCPQGVDTRGDRFQPLYNNGYFKVDRNQLSEFVEMDIGFDFYAPQTYTDNGKVIMIGWMGMPDVDYTNVNDDEWQHCLTIPRELVLVDGAIRQKPIEELKALRCGYFSGQSITLENNSFEMVLNDIQGDLYLKLREDVVISYENQLLRLDMGNSGQGRTSRILELAELTSLKIYSDITSLEIFVNDGINTISTRVYNDSCKIESNCQFEGYILEGFNIEI
ncbi:MAG: glycoside hydrolase family 32 protein [Erysipelotrichaceae bacterium]|nr:glycoside hydrolase family 32 protein [Erysipelotrichaceae bacterium]MDD3809029.1 glycoside hydrolase family 32 protein [Erysipelotrichaceae bacterium]